MPKYLVLIYGDQQRWNTMTAVESKQIDEGHRDFVAKAGAAILASGQLDTADKAATVRAGSDERPLITDGPFLETKEVVGGFYLLEAASLTEATDLAGALAEASHDHSGIEVRPLVNHN
ncbi:YciI family protein [Streptomyces boninensis]|uniref:YciI family protein n=1 Tax=Streptomyces boninensis TaxID=2039455 RepID=UPI003B213158